MRSRRALALAAAVVSLTAFSALAASAAEAEPQLVGAPALEGPPGAEYGATVAPKIRHRTFGMSMDLGVPDGAALGIIVRPQVEWLRVSAAATHNGIAPGVRVGMTIDPIAFPIAPTVTVEAGHYWAGTIPTVQGSPSIGYDYANFHLGLEFGTRASFRFFLRGGVSWVDMSTAQAQNPSVQSSAIANPSYTGWLAPSAKLGFAVYF